MVSDRKNRSSPIQKIVVNLPLRKIESSAIWKIANLEKLNHIAENRVWDVNSGEMLQIFDQHKEAVLHLKFANGTMVTCSKEPGVKKI
uniref:Uncharacterized protein n=1 Tax=Romanomermis culicivorax TaxID=13658 RepID=A0A915K9P6_ROMCU